MLSELKRALVATILLAGLVCGVYPALVTLIGQLTFATEANGSFIIHHGHRVGSRLIGQTFSTPQYFHGRPSAAAAGHDGMNSSGSNLGPTNQMLHTRMATDLDRILSENPTLLRAEIPPDMITASGSGLDPDISPQNALAQAPRVAAARQLDLQVVRALVASYTQPPVIGLLGEATINVLALNLAIDTLTHSQP